MKKILAATTLLTSLNGFAFDVNLTEQGTMSVDQLVEMGAEHVQCAQMEPRCLLMGTKYGIQYPGQKVSEVTLSEASTAPYAATLLKRLRQDGFCK